MRPWLVVTAPQIPLPESPPPKPLVVLQHRDKARYGPAQQAYILINAFQRFEGRGAVRVWRLSGCPLASINRILERGVSSFRNLEVGRLPL